MGIPLLKRQFSNQILDKKNYNSKYWYLILTKCFQNKFWTSESAKTRNMNFHFCLFSGWGTSQGPKLIPKAVFKLSPI